MPYLSASEVMIHEEVLYQVYVHLPLPPSLRHEAAVLISTVCLELAATNISDSLLLNPDLKLFVQSGFY